MNNLLEKLEKLHLQQELLLIQLEKQLDKEEKKLRILGPIVNIILLITIFFSAVGWIGLVFPRQLNGFTLWVAEFVLTFSFFNGIGQLLNNWKYARESERDWQERIQKRNEQLRMREQEQLLIRKKELENPTPKKEERLVN